MEWQEMIWQTRNLSCAILVGTALLATTYTVWIFEDARDPAVAKLLEKRRAKTTELPFSYRALDPARPDFESMIGGASGRELSPDLIPLWNGGDGEVCATFLGGLYGRGGLYQISAEGRIRPLYDFLDSNASPDRDVSAEASLTAIRDGLCWPSVSPMRDLRRDSRSSVITAASPSISEKDYHDQ